MTEQDPNNTPETNDERQDVTGHSWMSTGDGAADQQQERRGEQAAEAEDPQHGGGRQSSTAGAGADEESSTEESATETRPEEAQAPEDLFDLMGEEGKKHKKKKPEPPKQASGQSTASPPKKEEKKYPAQAEIVYAGHRITIPREMSASEIIDELLEDDFPELTKENTEFNHDEARNRIVPTRRALKKGAYGPGRERGGPYRPSPTADSEDEPPSLTVHTRPRRQPLPPVHRVLAHDGVYEVRDTDLGTFTARIPGEVMMAEGVAPKVPRAPVSVLEKTLRIFRDRPEKEALITVVYDRRDGRHHPVWVDQRATATSIEYDSITESEDLTVYCEIHSHHSMEAFFSARDDRYERRATGLFGVIGRIDLEKPHAAFRYSCGHHFRPIPAASLFDEPGRVGELITEVA